jgi:hypothetical protein
MAIQAISSSTSSIDLIALAQAKAAANAKAAAAASIAASASTTATDQASQPVAAAQKTEGKPPAGAGGPKPAETGASTGSKSSSATKIYDKRDTNQDGVVSYQEELLYSVAHPTDETQSSQSSTPTSQLQSGLKAYQQEQQANTSGSTSLTSPLFAI